MVGIYHAKGVLPLWTALVGFLQLYTPLVFFLVTDGLGRARMYFFTGCSARRTACTPTPFLVKNITKGIRKIQMVNAKMSL